MSAQQRRLQKVLGHITASEPVALAGNDCWAKDEDYTRSKLNTSTMDSERANASFDVRELSYLLDGGKEMTEVRRCLRLFLAQVALSGIFADTCLHISR
jgi:hypothetical protein